MHITTPAPALPDARSLGEACAIDAASFVFSLASLAMIRIHGDFYPAQKIHGVFASIAGLTLTAIALACLGSPPLRSIRALRPEAAQA